MAIPTARRSPCWRSWRRRSWLKPLRALTKLPNELGSLAVSGTKITMEQPRMAGFTRDNRQYEFTARAAAQDITKPDMVELQGIRANFEMQDKVADGHIGEDRHVQQPRPKFSPCSRTSW